MGHAQRRIYSPERKTRSWEHAEEFRRRLKRQAQAASSASYAIVPAQPVHIASQPEGEVLTREKTIKFAVDKYLSDAKSHGLEKSTLSKLENIFRKQFLPRQRAKATNTSLKLISTPLSETWTDGALAKSKKQDRLIGFFWPCVRRGYIKQNPALEMGKIKNFTS